jgi:four helix bundle protein
VQRFTELKVWQRGHALLLCVYAMTVGFPVAKRYGLLSQLRRAALSVPPNIAEGSKRTGRQEYARFLLNIVEASLAEAEYLRMISRDLGCIIPATANSASKDVAELARDGPRLARESRGTVMKPRSPLLPRLLTLDFQPLLFSGVAWRE